MARGGLLSGGLRIVPLAMSETSHSVGRGRFVVLDGIDGCGKTTQALRLVRELDALLEQPVQHLREPGSTPVGEMVRRIVLSREVEPEPEVELLLFAAARRQLIEECIRERLSAGISVVCERFNGATFAYQACAGGLEEEAVLELLERWASPIQPDLELILDLDPRLARERAGQASDRIEDKGLAYQVQVAEGFRRYAELRSQAVLLDASGDVETLGAEILREVKRVL